MKANKSGQRNRYGDNDCGAEADQEENQHDQDQYHATQQVAFDGVSREIYEFTAVVIRTNLDVGRQNLLIQFLGFGLHALEDVLRLLSAEHKNYAFDGIIIFLETKLAQTRCVAIGHGPVVAACLVQLRIAVSKGAAPSSGGYNMDALTPAAAAQGRDNPARRLGRFGRNARLFGGDRADPSWRRARKVVGVCQFPSGQAAMEATPRHIVALDPEAVELVDRTMIDLGRGIPIFRDTIDRVGDRRAREPLDRWVHGLEDQPLLTQLAQLETLVGDSRAGGTALSTPPTTFPSGDRRSARGGLEHHDVDEGRRQTDLLH